MTNFETNAASPAPAGPPAEPVSWFGYGRMGEPMVQRLLAAGTPVQVWNRSPARLESIKAPGATVLRSGAEATAPVMFSMLANDDALDALVESADGPLRAATAPSVWVDCSTVSVQASRRAAAAAGRAGTAFVCAPVSGNPNVVRAGKLTLVVSGEPAAVDRVQPLIDLIGPTTHRVGAGHEARVVKLCTNAVLAALTNVLAEVLVVGEKAGVSRGDLMRFINDSVMASPFTRMKTSAFVELDFTPTFPPEGLHKDVRLMLDAAAGLRVAMPTVSAAEQALTRLINSGSGTDVDFAALLLQAARDAGLEVRPETTSSKQ
ncbi:MAG TPA: NAD(P)-dependent oxidoreductase [Trebonia sp.]|nr:NAD(P)-dependent oxidoreductase [Trebonia sp.]